MRARCCASRPNDITSLDPQQGTDLLSTRVATQLFEALYEFDYFAEPAKVIPCTAEAMPVITDGGKTWTIKMQKGIYFADDPAFKGQSASSRRRITSTRSGGSIDPNLRSGGDAALTDLIVGARPVVDAARKAWGEARLRRSHRGIARARPLHAADQAP